MTRTASAIRVCTPVFRRRARICLIVLCALPASACGFVLTSGPPANHESLNYFTCSESRVGPGLDYVAAGLSLVTAITGSADTDPRNEKSQRAAAAVEGAVWLASGYAGNNRVSSCRDAKQKLADRQTEALKARSPEASARSPMMTDSAAWAAATSRTVKPVIKEF